MTPSRDRVVTVLRAIVHEIRTERVTFMASSIAYNAFVSLLPLLFLLLAMVSAIGNQQLEASLISVIQSTVTPGVGEVLVGELRNASTGASVLGLAVLVWGMLRIFRSLDAAFSDIYETGAENSFTDQISDGIVVFGSMAGVIILAAVLESQLSFGASGSLGWLAHRLLLIVLVAGTLFPMYYLFPDEPAMRPVEVVPGVFVTASALVVFESAFQLYVAYSNSTAENSVLASILVFLTWLYFSGLVILVGAAVNAVLANRSADAEISPVVGGVPLARSDDTDRPGAAGIATDTLDTLQYHLATASEIEIVVDGEPIALSPPERIETDLDDAPLPFVNDTVGIELRWSPEARDEE